MMLYIGASEPLPIIAWNEESPGFHVTELDRELDQKVCTQFTLTHVFYAGSYEGCGCGFSIGEYQDDDIDEEDENESPQARKSLADLAHYLEEALSKGISVQLFSCWDGDQGDSAEHRGHVTPGKISSERFWFEEMQFLEVFRDITNES